MTTTTRRAREPLAQMVMCASHSPGMVLNECESDGREFRRGLAVAGAMVEDFAPDLVVFFGSDHRRAFTKFIPAFAVIAEASGLGDLGSLVGSYDVPTHLAEQLTKFLLDRDFDAALAYGLELDHGFGQTFEHLLGALDRVPSLPIFINCANQPLPNVARTWELGEAVGRFARDAADRVLFVGSGGLSHSPRSLEGSEKGLSDAERRKLNREGFEEAKTKIDAEWDRGFLDMLSGADHSALRKLTDEDIAVAGVGAHEVRTWIAAAAAGGGGALPTIAYEPVPAWITGMGIAGGEITHVE